MECFSSEKVLAKHKVCLKLIGKQSVKLIDGLIKLKNYPKQLAMPFKIYADFESVLEGFQRYNRDSNTSCTKKYHEHIPFTYKVVCIDDRFSKSVVLYRKKITANTFIEAILNQYDYCILIMKKHFKKRLVMTVEDERSFGSSNKC